MYGPISAFFFCRPRKKEIEMKIKRFGTRYGQLHWYCKISSGHTRAFYLFAHETKQIKTFHSICGWCNKETETRASNRDIVYLPVSM